MFCGWSMTTLMMATRGHLARKLIWAFSSLEGADHRIVVELPPTTHLFLFRLTVVFSLVGKLTSRNSRNSTSSIRKGRRGNLDLGPKANFANFGHCGS